MAAEPDCVRLEIPIDTRYVRVVRLVCRGVGASAGLEVEDVDDLRIAVEELCAAMFDVSDGTPLQMSFDVHDRGVEVRGRTSAVLDARVDPERFTWSEQILKVAADEFSLSVENGRAEFAVRKLA